VPNPIAPPPGCAFHPRCPFANDRCRSERPLLKEAGGGGLAACHAVEEGRLPGFAAIAAVSAAIA
jgi:peptide/nickel transport system ATP-binding protein